MGVIGDYIYPADVSNQTKELSLIVVDGIAEPPTFSTVGPLGKSTNHSIDAFGAYTAGNGLPGQVQFKGASSAWWKVPDGTSCYVCNDTANGYRLIVNRGILDPSPSDPDSWGCTPAQIQLLLKKP